MNKMMDISRINYCKTSLIYHQLFSYLYTANRGPSLRSGKGSAFVDAGTEEVFEEGHSIIDGLGANDEIEGGGKGGSFIKVTHP